MSSQGILQRPDMCGAGARDIGVSMQHVCRSFGLTPRAVRLYEERGLITPGRDGHNRRSFGGEARRRLALIASLRAVGVGLESIERILTHPLDSSAANARMLHELRSEVDKLEQRRMAAETLHRPALMPTLERGRRRWRERVNHNASGP